MLLGAMAIFALVVALLALAFRSGRAPRTQVASERVWIVGLGLAFPAAVLLSLLAYGLWAGERLLPREAADVARVHAQAERWSWTFSYDDAPGRTTTDILHIPASRPVDVAITTTDVIHSFWVPRLAGKLDAIPGHVNVLRLEADVAGTYAGLSAEYSGPGYDRHSFTVIAHTPDSWRAFLEVDE
ncbi:MAG: cytochrome C oxidase subunit II [Aquamicrobium sp.]|nr:cytochrome C oxidase subunit II [Aquamicrobium sp.]